MIPLPYIAIIIGCMLVANVMLHGLKDGLIASVFIVGAIAYVHWMMVLLTA